MLQRNALRLLQWLLSFLPTLYFRASLKIKKKQNPPKCLETILWMGRLSPSREQSSACAYSERLQLTHGQDYKLWLIPVKVLGS